MSLPSTGNLSLSAVLAEFGGTATSLSELYRNGSVVNASPYNLIAADDSIPTSGNISLSDFYGTAYQAAPDTLIYSSPGSTTFYYPVGIASVTVDLIVGAGGGGSSESFCGDGFSGGAGGTGGYYQNVSITQQPKNTAYTVTVGAGGTGGPYPGTCAGHTNGVSGGDSAITKSGIDVYRATGGAHGTAPGVYPSPGYGGSGGTPNGVNGPGGGLLPYVPAGPTNGTGYGSGGQGNSGNGGNGYVKLSW